MNEKNDPEKTIEGFLARAKQSDCERLAASEPADGYRHLQVRLRLRDAKRFRCRADLAGKTMQDALVDAINMQMTEWGEAPVANPGAKDRKP